VRYFDPSAPSLFCRITSRIPFPESLSLCPNSGKGQGPGAIRISNEPSASTLAYVDLLYHTRSLYPLRSFSSLSPNKLRKLEEVLNIPPDDLDTVGVKAGTSSSRGDLPRSRSPPCSTPSEPVRPKTNITALETQIYQAILALRSAGPLGHLSGSRSYWLSQITSWFLQRRTAIFLGGFRLDPRDRW